MITVTGLICYPIKSCGGTALEVAHVGKRGIEHDREFMIVEALTGDFITQREEPRLALIRPQVLNGGLRVQAPGMPTLELERRTQGELRRVRVWQDTCSAVDQGEAAAGWLSEYVGEPVRLVRLADDHVRRVKSHYAQRPDDQVAFADAFPFLLISAESLADLNRRLAEPLPMNRFRPNIVVSGGGEPYLEDTWRMITIGNLVMHVVKPCARCVTTTTDQETALRGPEPLKTLATYRKVSGGVLFGQNLIHAGPGELRRGDRVTVDATRSW